MSDKKFKMISLGDMSAVYVIYPEGQVSFSLIPSDISEANWEKGRPDPLIQISCTGDASSPGFAA